MNAFTTIRPEAGRASQQAFVVSVFQDPQAECWIGICDEIPIATEAATVDALIDRVWSIAPEIAELNGLLEGAELQLQFVLNTRAAA